MCSSDEESLDRLVEAIDQLAAERPASDHCRERVAGIWALVEDIDPELARRRALYTQGP